VTSPSLAVEQARFEQNARPSWNGVSTLLICAAILALVLSLAAIVDQPSAAITAITLAAGVFIGLIFLALASSLRWLQLIEWRLGMRADSAMLSRSIYPSPNA
jgi:predicted lysophospholipase L1 biosynthesis ABC-type transport system permease subunit